jgi:hypothetical protein
MRNITLLSLLAISLIIIGGCGKKATGLKDTPPKVKLYAIPAVRIEYEYTGASVGTKVQIIANHGMYQREEDNFTMNIGEQKREIKTLTIRNDSISYNIDLTKKEGMSTPTGMDQLEAMTKSFNKEQLENVNAELLVSMGGKKIGKETVLGKECDVYDLSGSMKICMWKGIVLKSEMQMGAHKMNLIAKKIDTDVTPTIEDFSVPKDIKIKSPQADMGLPPNHPPIDSAK